MKGSTAMDDVTRTSEAVKAAQSKCEGFEARRATLTAQKAGIEQELADIGSERSSLLRRAALGEDVSKALATARQRAAVATSELDELQTMLAFVNEHIVSAHAEVREAERHEKVARGAVAEKKRDAIFAELNELGRKYEDKWAEGLEACREVQDLVGIPIDASALAQAKLEINLRQLTWRSASGQQVHLPVVGQRRDL